MMEIKQKVNKLLDLVIKRGASDLHLVVGRAPTIRVDRILVPIEGEKELSQEEVEKMAHSFLNERQKAIYAKDKELDFSYAYDAKARFRINVYNEKGNKCVALRLIPSKIKTVEELGLPVAINQFAKQFQGLVLIVGPSGHGKSTTLAALIDLINHTRNGHIITIEDPIEYLFKQDKSIVNQRELNRDTNSFARALRSALREDGDVIMVGEMRDLDTIATAITVAETGHLVFSTLHTNTAVQTIDRIIDAFPPHQQNQIRVQLASILSGIVSQRLIPRVGGGRVVASEVLFVNAAVKNLIRENKAYQIDSVIQTSGEEGMIPLDKSLASLVQQKQISMENALLYANDPAQLSGLLKK